MSSKELYLALFAHLSMMTSVESERAAGLLTRAIEQAISQRLTQIDCSLLPEELKDIASVIAITPASLSIPWHACRALQYGEVDPWAYTPMLDCILATGPDEYGDGVSVPWSKMQPHPRSLLLYLSNLIFSASERLLVVTPYWSTDGIANLKRVSNRDLPAPKDVVVMTSGSPTKTNRRGLSTFASWMRSEGATLRVLTPKPLSDGREPLVHAKVMLADGERGYLGSANISENGLHRSIEAGVGLKGPAVYHLEKWYINMWPHFEEIGI